MDTVLTGVGGFFKACLAILVVAVIVAAAIYGDYYVGFDIYKKKHGEHMTYFDYFFDTERAR